ncbi:GNAT family N-acetyltransferase [Haloplasma contractile]|uniref:Protease synthase protein n=1 Tax=Haloplasma contractile SSD-17B TaxID=1033810 RepID=F7Q211_9MOLU|nr:GNAT family N-acetyltransferase [Haloplasma contractile]ERJ12181.1 Protease synthase protein [Haloplasma contractile SSD-17B]
MKFTNLMQDQIEDVISIVKMNYQKARENLPLLSDKYENREIIKKIITELNPNHFIVATIDGKVVGFITAYYIDEFKGTVRGALSLPHMHGVKVGYDQSKIYNLLYKEASMRWTNKECYTHCMLVYNGDYDTLNTWFYNGFGLLVIDAVRDLNCIPLPDIKDDITIRQANPYDVPRMVSLLQGIKRHLKSAPIFLTVDDEEDSDLIKEYLDWTLKESNNLWIAEQNNQIIGYLKTNTTEINQDELQDGETLGINGAYVLPEFRGKHIMSRLINLALLWAKENGLKRCSTDFETANLEGRSYWLKHFKPYSYGLIRRIDERNHLRFKKA